MLAVLALSACGTAEPRDTETPTTAHAESRSPSASASSSPTPTPTPPPTPTSLIEQIEFSCSVEDAGGRKTFATLEKAWEHQGAIDHCEAGYGNGYIPHDIPKSDLSDLEWSAVQTSYPDDPEPDNAATLYSICASNTGIPIDEVVSPGQARELSGALLLCPDHPKIEQMTLNAAAQDEMQAEEDALEADRENGRFVEPGNYLVGSEIPAGTWRAQGNKVTDCYWEISDGNGEIIANNFVSTSAPFNVKVPSHASGFTVEGCSFRWVSE